MTAGAGARFSPAPWLDFEASVPLKWVRSHDHALGHSVETLGFGDLALSASWDILELLNPSLLYRLCPDSNLWIYTPTDHFNFFKNPHLTLAAGLSCPTGCSDIMDEDHGEPLDPRYQPGAGVWIPSLALDYSQGIGRVYPGIGIQGSFPIGEDSTGLRRFPSWSFSAGATLRSKAQADSWALDVSLACEWVGRKLERDGAPLPGSRGNSVALRIGGSLGLGRGFIAAAQLTWGISDNRGHAENPYEPGLGAGVYFIAPVY